MPIRTLDNKKCFITGAASGIGRATAIACAAEGAELFLTDINEVELERVVENIRASGGRVAAHRAFDIAQLEAVQEFADAIHAAHGTLDVVMNVAGISTWGTLDSLQHRHWRQIIEVNLMGPIHVIECFVTPMIKAGRGGHLVNVSSAAGLFGLPWHAAYSASKFGLRGISEVLRFDLERHGIGVSLVCPGGVRTGLVNTIQILGVDSESRYVKKMKKSFEWHAVSSEQAARAIVKGVKRNQYLVFTSNDIRVGYWLKNHFELGYEMTMRQLNNRMERLKRAAPSKPTEEVAASLGGSLDEAAQ